MNSALKLYEISHQFQALEQLGETDDLPAEVIANTLEALEGDFEVKALQVAKFIVALEANGSAIEEAAKGMMVRAMRVQKRAESIRAYLQFHMQALEKKRIEGTELVISRKANPPAVIVTDEASVPEQFWIQPPQPPKRVDKPAIKAAFAKGERVPGAFIEAGERLDIKC